MKSRTLFVVAVLGISLHVPSAHAFRSDTCGDTRLSWDPDLLVYPDVKVPLVRNSYSIFPTTLRGQAYRNNVLRWNQAPHVDAFSQYGAWPRSHQDVDFGDGWNEVAVVSSSDIDGDNGRTHKEYSTWCPLVSVLGASSSLVEADVMVGSQNPFGWSSEQFPAIQGTDGYADHAMLHEFGHALGLQHSDVGFSVMRTLNPRPQLGGDLFFTRPQHGLMGDDVNGANTVFYYFGPGNERNVAASAQTLVNNTVVRSNGSLFIASPGDSIVVNLTVVSQQLSDYLGSTDTIDSEVMLVDSYLSYGGRQLTTFSTTLAAGTFATVPVTLTVPSDMQPGDFRYIVHRVSVSDAEKTEDDNAVRVSALLVR